MTIRSYTEITPHIHPSAYIDPLACVIGEVEIGADSSVWPMAVIRGDVNRVRIGARTSVQDGTVIHVTHRHPARPQGHATLIGDEVTIGHRAVLHGCRVGDRCLIGIGAVILDGATVHDEVILGAGSLVTEGKELAGGFLYHGSPARQIRPLTDEERERLRYAAAHYVKLKNNYAE